MVHAQCCAEWFFRRLKAHMNAVKMQYQFAQPNRDLCYNMEHSSQFNPFLKLQVEATDSSINDVSSGDELDFCRSSSL